MPIAAASLTQNLETHTMSRRLGMHARMYRSSTLCTDDTPSHYEGKTWLDFPNCRDVTLNLETGEADVTTRDNDGWRQTLATLKDGSVEFELVWDTTDTNFQAIKDAWLDSTEIAFAIMTGDIETDGEEGLVGNFSVTNFSRSEALEDAIKVNVTLKPSSFNNWYVVGES
jgi:hypothetical protein